MAISVKSKRYKMPIRRMNHYMCLRDGDGILNNLNPGKFRVPSSPGPVTGMGLVGLRRPIFWSLPLRPLGWTLVFGAFTCSLHHFQRSPMDNKINVTEKHHTSVFMCKVYSGRKPRLGIADVSAPWIQYATRCQPAQTYLDFG